MINATDVQNRLAFKHFQSKSVMVEIKEEEVIHKSIRRKESCPIVIQSLVGENFIVYEPQYGSEVDSDKVEELKEFYPFFDLALEKREYLESRPNSKSIIPKKRNLLKYGEDF